jgi:hypothetical protein
MTTASASFDTTTGMLSLLDASGNDLGDFHFAGDASGLYVNRISSAGFVTINDTDQSFGANGNIPITFHT